jgi:hypothetical protein
MKKLVRAVNFRVSDYRDERALGVRLGTPGTS